MAYTTIKKPSDYFEPITFTASNASSNTVSGMGFQPDLIWWKNREQTYPHFLYDVIRGNTKQLASNTSGAEETRDSTYLTSFNSDGFTTGTALAGDTSDGIASWNWKANGAGSANTDGTISSTVSANTTSGFSIAKYTGTGANASFGHGLGTTPAVYIIKRLTGAAGTWLTYHQSLGIGYHLGLNNTTAQNANDATFANNTAPDISKIYLGSWGDLNANGSDFICYSFAEKQGFSKFGSYIGNSSTNGTFIYTGFKPAFVMVKKYAGTGSWFMKDAKRNSYNPAEETIAADSASSAAGWGTGDDIDLLSNGFKMRDDTANINTNGDGYIYMAFAEQPLVGDNPATAR